MIRCQDLTCRYGDFVAVDKLTLDVPAGSICAFLGPNGAGKSTTVKMLTGLVAPTSGSATVADLDVVRDAAQLKKRIGVLPENLGLFDDLTVQEHLDLTGAVYGLEQGADSRPVGAVVARAASGTRAGNVRQPLFAWDAQEDVIGDGAAGESAGAVSR